MTQTIRAAYRDGVFVPLEKVDLPENTVVTITIPLTDTPTPNEIIRRLREAGGTKEFDSGEEPSPENRKDDGRIEPL